MSPDVTSILIAVAANLAVIVLAVSLWLVWRSYTSEEQRRTVRTMVQAAEQQFSAGEERREWAMKELAALFPKLSPQLLNALLEAAVYELHVEREEIEVPRRLWFEEGDES